MTIIRCPRCRDEVTAPAKASRLAIVRCPLCLEEYPLADALRQVPPTLIVVGSDAEADTQPEAGGWQPGEAVSSAAATADVGVFDASPGAGVAAPAPSRPVAKAQRPKRRERSAVGNFIGIVFGGLGGIGLGLLVLWWVFRQDVGVGPTVARYAPWIVPAQFHGKPESGANTGGTAAASTANAAVPRPNTAGGKKSKPPPVSAVTGYEEPPSSLPEPGSLDNIGGASPLAPAGNSAFETPPAAKANPPVPKAPDLTDLLAAGTPPAAAVTPPASRPPAEELGKAVSDAAGALERYDNFTGDDAETKRGKFTEMYVAVSEAGRLVSLLDAQDAEFAAPVGELKAVLEKIAGIGGPSKLSAVKFLASSHWPQRKQGAGLLVAGTVKEIKRAGPQHEITLDAASRGLPLEIPVVSIANPEKLCQAGDELVIAGRIVEDPKANLPGYDGAAPRVLMLGYCVKVPKAP